jgi:hypothetical protein
MVIKRTFRLAGYRHLYLTSALIAAALGSLALFELSWPPSATGADALLKSAKTAGSESADVRADSSVSGLITSSLSLPSYSEDAIQATPRFTYTAFLPLVSTDYWMCPGSALGVQVYSLDSEVAAQIAQMGACWVRVPLPWSGIEPANTTPENYQWPADFDRGLARLAELNIKAVLTLAKNPSWAATYSGGPVDKTNLDELVEFMVAAVAHYGAKPYNVKYWEFYNEPDNASEVFASRGYGYFGDQPQVYASMLAAVYQPMKTVDPQAQIVMGGLAYDNWPEDGGHFVKDFLDGVLQNGGGDFFDVMNFHYYASFAWRWDAYGKGISGKAAYLRDKLAAYGYDKPLICTESGTYSKATDPVSSDRQSRYVVQLFTRAIAADLDSAMWWLFTDIPSWEYGLLKTGSSPKPSFYAYRTSARQLSFARYLRTVSSAKTGSEQIEAYEFLALDRSSSIIVAWTNDDLNHAMSLTTDHVVVADMYGSQTTIYDGDDGKTDGQVKVTIGPGPVYLRWPYVPADQD